jgi:hypothetical protein
VGRGFFRNPRGMKTSRISLKRFILINLMYLALLGNTMFWKEFVTKEKYCGYKISDCFPSTLLLPDSAYRHWKTIHAESSILTSSRSTTVHQSK